MSSPSISEAMTLNGNFTPVVKKEEDPEGSMPFALEAEPTVPQSSEINITVKGEPQELMSGPLIESSVVEEKGKRKDLSATLVKSVNDLSGLSISINAFKSRLDELQKHLDFIDRAIETKSKEFSDPIKIQETSKVSTSPSSCNAQAMAPANLESSTKQDYKLDLNPTLIVKQENGKVDELQSLCQSMCSRGLRKYVVSRLKTTDKLREQVPPALKFSPKPARLVIECIGRFYLQGSKAYTKKSPMIPARQASILVLEYFLLSGCADIEIEPFLKEEANSAAIAWKKRLVLEGGLSQACEIDARGLLLFVASFGIPNAFNIEDMIDLIHLSNPREISQALSQSLVLVARIPDVIDGMQKKGMAVEAVDIACIFGLEEQFSPQEILMSILNKFEEAWEKTIQEKPSSPLTLKEAKEYLAALKSVLKCSEDHYIDLVKLLSGGQIREKISSMENYITELDKLISKRKVENSESLNTLKSPETKRKRFTAAAGSSLLGPPVVVQEQRVALHVDVKKSYNDSILARYPNHLNDYTSALSHQPEYIAGSLPSIYASAIATKVDGTSAGIGVASADSVPGYHGDMILDRVSIKNNSSSPYAWRGGTSGEAALLNDRSVRQGLAGQSTSARGGGLYAISSSSLEGFLGRPDNDVPNRSLYSFADAVLEGESIQSSSNASRVGHFTPTLPSHRSSSLY